MTTEKTNELEGVKATIMELLNAHNCQIMATPDFKAIIIADKTNPKEEYIFSSGLIKKL